MKCRISLWSEAAMICIIEAVWLWMGVDRLFLDSQEKP